LPDTQIIGGTDALDGQYPYQVSLKRTLIGKHICGGVIISQKYVITAAHCLEKYTFFFPLNFKNIQIFNTHTYTK